MLDIPVVNLCKFYGLYHLKVETCIFLVLCCFGLSVCLNYMLWWCYTHLRYEYTPNLTLLLWHGLTNQCFDECREKRLNIISHISSNTCMDNQWTMSPLENGTSGYFTNRTVMQSSPLCFSHYQPRRLRWVVGNITCTVIILLSSSLSPVAICDPPCMNGRCENGRCTNCPEGHFGVNCTGESYVIKLCS